jgi:hypothetical protein
MSVIINILASIGLIVIISYLIYYAYEYAKYKSHLKTVSEINPPPTYMQNSGIKCPDYWENIGVDNKGNYICKNSFGLSSGKNDGNSFCSNVQCYDENNQTSFPSIKSKYTWEFGNPNGMTSLSDKEKYDFVNSSNRCKWLNCCGPSKNIQAVWSGVNETCNTAPDLDLDK